MLKALIDFPDIEFVVAKHETNAVFMAMGYSLSTGRPGAVLTTAGPGVTNAVTGMAAARYEGLPIIHIAGDVPTSAFGRDALQESGPYGLNAVGLLSGVAKFAAQITRPDMLASHVHRALATAMSGVSGPAFISIPLDIGAAEAKSSRLAGHAETTLQADKKVCLEVAGLLEEARRPLFLAGSDCRSSVVRRALLALSEHSRIPVAVTPRGKGVFPEDHPNYLGLFGFGGHENVIEYLKEGIDFLVVIGSRVDDFSTNAWSPLLKPSVALVQIDRDLLRLGRSYSVDFGLLGPVDTILDELRFHVNAATIPRERHWPTIRYQHIEPSNSGILTTHQVMCALNDACPDNAVFMLDMGEHLSFGLHFLRVTGKRTFFTALGLGAMGSSPVVGIGHQIGCKTRPVYMICGDGGFLMSGNELVTAVQHDVPCTILVVNDSRLNMCHHGMRDLYGRTNDFSTHTVDFASVAQSMGAQGLLIHTYEELLSALKRPARSPRVLDVRIDPDVRLRGSQRNSALKHFTD